MQTTRSGLALGLGFILTLTLTTTAAQAQTLQKTARDWRVFTLAQGGEKTCYIVSMPTKKEGNYNKRGEPFVIVTHKNANTDEVSVSSGYPYKENAPVKVSIDDNTHQLFAKGERAWAKDSDTDRQMVRQMKKGRRMSVRGNSKLDTFSKDTYSLLGFTAAYRKMKELCGAG